MADIKIQGLCKAFDGKPLFQDLTLTIPQGSRICIMGESGCGKTTLLRILLGLESPDFGEVTGVGRACAVFQENRLCMDFNARTNVSITAASTSTAEDIDGCLSSLLPADSLRKPVRQLSGGMLRRVALARALMAEGDVLILDEPFGGLDEETRARVAEYLCAVLGDRTLVMVSHDAEDARLLGAEILPFPV